MSSQTPSAQENSNSNHVDQAPTSATAAVLVPSAPVPDDVRKVRGVDFNDYVDRDITVSELVSNMSTMGFQASAIGEAVRIINDMRAFRDPETGERTTIFMGYTSNLISSGLR